jgi:hypothetical protein
MRQHLEQGIAAAQILFDQGMTPQRELLPMLTQHQQARGVVDLGIHEQHRSDACVTQLPGGLQGWKGFDLLEHVWRCVHQDPVLFVGGDGDRRLCSRTVMGAARTHRGALGAIAIPLGVTATCCRTENMDFQNNAALRKKTATSAEFEKCKKWMS